MAAKKVKDKAQADFEEEIQTMVEKKEFQDERDAFSPMVRKYAEKSQKTEDDGWDLLTRKIVEVLPVYLTDGMITCSLEKIGQEGPCRDVADHQNELTITPGDNFPENNVPDVLSVPRFHPPGRPGRCLPYENELQGRRVDTTGRGEDQFRRKR